jgi:hypothetical protein
METEAVTMQFTTNPKPLSELLEDCASGKLQLPDFQRSWVWDEERIKSLIASISQAFPIGALMTLKLRHGDEAFARRPVEGAPAKAKDQVPDELILDGQQRMTSLYQTCLRREVVRTITPRQRIVHRWFYIDIRKALDRSVDREEAIFVIPETKLVTEDFARRIILDLTTPQKEYENLCYPVHSVFDWDDWQDGFNDFWNDADKRSLFRRFKDEVLKNFDSYQVPVISLGADTSHEAVCLVFEKVNTGGKPLDAFELVTAMYAAKGFRLRDDWFGVDGEPGLQERLHTYGHVANQRLGILAGVQSTDVLQAIALLYSKAERERARQEGKPEAELPAVRATRQSLLDLPLEAYKKYRLLIEQGFKDAAKFLRQQGLYRVYDLPYQSQIVPLAAILALLGDRWENTENKAKLARWYWCGIFGELYGSATETRFARDVVEVPAWLDGGNEPTTVRDGVLRQNRLRQLKTRQSAAYKGVNALLLREGAEDFRTGQPYDVTMFFDENVDIHHIFPVKWCVENHTSPSEFDTVINKTPLSAGTNRRIGGEAPSHYIARLERGGGGDPAINPAVLDGHLGSHALDPQLLRADDFEGFFVDRERRLLRLIAAATGHQALVPADPSEEGEAIPNDIARDAGLTANEGEVITSGEARDAA